MSNKEEVLQVPTKSTRHPISKALRFKVFARDGFTCQYCGQRPPTVTLQIDHLRPVAVGGDNAESNLISACSSCNAGKSAKPIAEPRTTKELAKRADDLEERLEQLQRYREAEEAIDIELREMAWNVINHWHRTCGYEEDTCSRYFYASVHSLLKKFTLTQIHDAIYEAGSWGIHKWKYVCGILWKGKKEQ